MRMLPSSLAARVFASIIAPTARAWRFLPALATMTAGFAFWVDGARLVSAQVDSAADESNLTAKTSNGEQPATKDDKPAQPAAGAAEVLKYTCSVVDKETGKGIPNARVVVRRSILTSQENRIVAETRHTTDAAGAYVFEIPPEQAADRYLYIELDVEHDDYAAKNGHGYALSMILKNEKLGARPFFERTALYPAPESVTGTVLSPDGRPLSEIKVQGYSMADQLNFESGSFTVDYSDAEGKFRLKFPKGADAVLWVNPKEFAGVEKFLAKQRGDIGEVKLTIGARVHGRIVNSAGQPATGVAVNIEPIGTRDVGGLPVGNWVTREAFSDAEGEFSFDPVPAGKYRVEPAESMGDPLAKERRFHSLPAAFVAKRLVVKDGIDPRPLKINALPEVIVHAEFFDSAGNKTRGNEFILSGILGGNWWNGVVPGEGWLIVGRPDANGEAVLHVPRGLQNTQLILGTNEHGALRFRLGKDRPLQNNAQSIDLGTLNEDVNDLEVIRYKAPIVLFAAVDEEQKPIKAFRVEAKYTPGEPEKLARAIQGSDLNLEHQDDGRFRTTNLLPDEEVVFTISADGFESASENVTLREGETKDLVLPLKKAKAPDELKPAE